MVEATQSEKPEQAKEKGGGTSAAPISLFRLGFTILMTFFFGSALVDSLTPNYNYFRGLTFDLNSVVFLVVIIPLGSYLVADAIHSCFHNWGKEVKLQSLWSGLTGKFTMTFGLILPCISLVTLTVMIFMSGGGFYEALRYEPVRMLMMLLAYVSMPVINFVTWRALVRSKENVRARLHGLLNGVAIGISFVFCAITFNPLWQFSNMVASNFGNFASSAVAELLHSDPGRLFMALWIIIPALGIFSFLTTPLLSFVSSLLISASFWNLPSRRPARLAAFHAVMGVFVAMAVIFGPEIPVYVTKVGYLKAVSSEADAGRAGIRLLRAFGSEQELLKICYDAYHWGRMPQIWELICRSWNLNYGYATDYISIDRARDIYYRVTGKPFNTVAKPHTWDQWWNTERNEQGGTIIGGRIKDLHLQESAITGDVDPDSLVGYMEWTFVFKNDSKQQQEARTQIALPFGGVVSRVSLWINGKPCEAAFDERNLVRNAYRSVVAVRRDPVLVTSAGRDRIMMQCFPVPADGGTMKVRLGISFPLTMETEKQAFVALPKLVENNFDVLNRHQITLSAKRTGTSRLSELAFSAGKGAATASAGVSNEDLLSDKAVVAFDRDARCNFVRVVDAKNNRPQVTQEIRHVRMANQPKMIVVVDGSGAMKKHAVQLVKVLEVLKPLDTEVLFASDEISSLSDSEDGAVKLKQALVDLPVAPFVGGPDNSVSLLKAVEKAGRDGNTAIVWLHGPQPVLFNSDPYRVIGDFGQHRSPVAFFDVEVEPGPNRLLEVLSDPRYRLPAGARLRPLPRHGTLESDMSWLVRWLSNKQEDLELVRTRHTGGYKITAPVETLAAESSVSRHLIDLCSAAEAEQLFSNFDEHSAMKLASFYRLVTPLTSAVVLETPQQYANFGLDPHYGLRVGEKAPVPYKLALLMGGVGQPIPTPMPTNTATPVPSPVRGAVPVNKSSRKVAQKSVARALPVDTGVAADNMYMRNGQADGQADGHSQLAMEESHSIDMDMAQSASTSSAIASAPAMPTPSPGSAGSSTTLDSYGAPQAESVGGGSGIGAGSRRGDALLGYPSPKQTEVSSIEFQGNYASKNMARDANLFDGGAEQRQAMNTAKTISKIASKARYVASDEHRSLTMIVTVVGWLLKFGLVLVGLRLIGFGTSKRDVTPVTIGYVLALAVMAVGIHYLMNVAIAVLNAS